MRFDEDDYKTWPIDDEALPVGYEWRIFDEVTGEYHLYSPDGRDLTEASWANDGDSGTYLDNKCPDIF